MTDREDAARLTRGHMTVPEAWAASGLAPDPRELALAATACPCCGAPSTWYGALRSYLSLSLFVMTMAPFPDEESEWRRQAHIRTARAALAAWRENR